jgi:hypothetical protein
MFSVRLPKELHLPVILMALLVSVTGCGEATSQPQRAPTTGPERPVALRITEVPIPKLDVPKYITRGTYPQVADGHTPLAKVNAALTNVVRSEQRRYARVVRKSQKDFPPLDDQGLFATNFRSGVASASSVVVSTLIPLTRRFPSGTGGQTWLSATIRVPSGRSVSVGDLFADRSRGLRALAAAVRRQVVAGNSCIRQSIDELPEYASGFAPTTSNYQHFALTASGLAIGLEGAQVGFVACNRVRTTVSYARLRAELSPLARKLIANIRQPRTG